MASSTAEHIELNSAQYYVLVAMHPCRLLCQTRTGVLPTKTIKPEMQPTSHMTMGVVGIKENCRLQLTILRNRKIISQIFFCVGIILKELGMKRIVLQGFVNQQGTRIKNNPATGVLFEIPKKM